MRRWPLRSDDCARFSRRHLTCKCEQQGDQCASRDPHEFWGLLNPLRPAAAQPTQALAQAGQDALQKKGANMKTAKKDACGILKVGEDVCHTLNFCHAGVGRGHQWREGAFCRAKRTFRMCSPLLPSFSLSLSRMAKKASCGHECRRIRSVM